MMSSPVSTLVGSPEYKSLQQQHSPLHDNNTSYRRRGYSKWTRALSYIGPGFMIAVGYLDPGNWATDLAAGSQFGYNLLFIILISNICAIVLQGLAIKLGVVTNMDLAQCCRSVLPRPVNLIFYIFCEIAIIACDLAEVIGTAIALDILFNIPLEWGVALTGLDVLIIMTGWGKGSGVRYFEYGIMVMVLTVASCFVGLLWLSQPSLVLVLEGFLPKLSVFKEHGALFIATSIVGATVMPHNLYLHSHIVKRRSPQQPLPSQNSVMMDSEDALDEPPRVTSSAIRETLHLSSMDSVLSLILASLVNAAILIVAAASFYNPTGDNKEVADLKDAHALLIKHLGPVAGFLFGMGLFMSGQSSTITGTIAGQVIMEGFLGTSFNIPQWARRLMTRMVAIVPAMTVVLIKGEKGVNDLLVLSQVILSLQLPFAIWPLVYFTCSSRMMTLRHIPPEEDDVALLPSDSDEEYAMMGSPLESETVDYSNGPYLRTLCIALSAFITILDIILVILTIRGQ